MNTHREHTRSKAPLWLAVAFFAAAVAVLAATAERLPDQSQFFGLWRTKHFLAGVASGCAALLCVACLLGKRVLFACMLAGLLTFVSLLLLEIGGVFGVPYGRLFGRVAGESVGSAPVPHQEIEGTAHEDLALAWGYPTTDIPFRFRTDARGFRNPTDRDAADVYLLGDSILVAGLIPFADTVTGKLEAALARPVMNLSLIGIGPQQERDLFVEADLPLEGRFVLHFVFEGNDLLDSAGFRSGDGEDGETWVDRSFSYNLLVWLQRMTDPMRPARHRQIGRIGEKDYLFIWTDRSFRGVEGEFSHVTGVYRTLRDRVVARGGSYAIVFMPAKIRVLGPHCSWPAESSLRDFASHLSPMRDRLRTWAAERNVALLDLTEPLQSKMKTGAVPWFAGDSHPNAVGHEVISKAISEWATLRTWVDGSSM